MLGDFYILHLKLVYYNYVFSVKDSSSGSEYEYKYQLNVNKKKIKKKKFEILKSSSQNTDTGNIFIIQDISCIVGF